MSIISTEDKLETILYHAKKVQIIPIPPPSKLTKQHNISFWNLDNVIWQGELFVIEQETYQQDEENSGDSLKCKIELVNSDHSHWADIWYNEDSVRITDSYKIYSVLATFEEKKIGLGLIFRESENALEFNSALREYRKHSDALKEDSNEHIDISVIMERHKERSSEGENKEGNFVYHNSESDEEEDFGDFISSDDFRKD